MSVRRSSRSIKPVENFGDVTFVGSYTKKYEAMKIAAAEKKAAEIKAKEALKLASKTKVKSTVTKATATKTGPKKNKKKIKRKKEEWVDDFESLASDDDDMDMNVDCAYNPVPQKVKISRRKPPKDKYDHSILMDMWASDISDISSHKSIDISCPNDDSSILTGVPLWSDMWVNSAPVTSEVKECLSVDDVATEENLDDDQISGSRRSRQTQMHSSRSRTHGDSMQDNLAESWADPHVLVAPYTFGQIPSHVSEVASMPQPFSVKVHPQVTFVSDFHAHMCDAEVIGLLAGKWDATNNCIYIQSSFPCFSTVRVEDDGSTDVEMDPGAEIATREAIHRLGLKVVGWYHSHPCFRPDPSTTDIVNQHSYQQLFRDAETGVEPFVGLIVSTFDPRRANVESLHQWFHAVPFTNPVKSKKFGDMYLPMKIEVVQLEVSASMCPTAAWCSNEDMESMKSKLLSIATSQEEELEDVEADEKVSEEVDDDEEVGDDADISNPEKPVMTKAKARGKTKAKGKAKGKEKGKVEEVVRESAEEKVEEVVPRKRGRPPKKKPVPLSDSVSSCEVNLDNYNTNVPPPTHSSRGRAQKKRKLFEESEIASSKALAHFSGSGSDKYAPSEPQASVNGKSAENDNNGDSDLQASGRRSSRARTTTRMYGDYFDENDEEFKGSFRTTKTHFKTQKSKGNITRMADDENDQMKTIPNTNVRYSINRKNKTISSVSKVLAVKPEPRSSSSDPPKKKCKKAAATRQKTEGINPVIAMPSLPIAPRFISLVTGLQKDTPLAALARQLICSVAPVLQCSMLSIVAISFYYSLHARRTTLTKPWRKKTKIDKVRMSISVWLKYFGLLSSDEEKILDSVIELLDFCWRDGNGNRNKIM